MTNFHALSTNELAEKYVALWNEPDPSTRASLIQALWTDDGEHVLDPPQEMVAAARALGCPTAKLEVQGHAELEARAAQAYDEFVRPGAFRFRARGSALRLRDIATLRWEMVRTDTGEIVGAGLEVLQLNDEARIVIDRQFVGV